MINILDFNAAGLLKKSNQFLSGSLTWSNVQGEVRGSVGIFLRVAHDEGNLELSYVVSGLAIEPKQIDYRVGLETTRPYFGGKRWWFTCPACESRVAKLYRPPQADQFLCRDCHGVSYRSSQESDKRVSKLRKKGLKAILDFMENASPSDLILGLKAMRRWI